MVVSEIDRIVLARDLIRAGMRTPYVQKFCALSQKQVAELWKSVHGDAPMKGKLHESAAAFLESRRDHALYSGFAVFCRSVFRDGAGPEVLLKAWTEYRQIVGAQLDINGCYYVMRDLRVGALNLIECADCGALMLDEWGRRAPRCPFCGYRVRK